MVAASAESGSAVTPPDSMATRIRSRRNCGLPPDRVATTSSTCDGSGCCSAANFTSRNVSPAASGASSILMMPALGLSAPCFGALGARSPTGARSRTAQREPHTRGTPRPYGVFSNARSVVPGEPWPGTRRCSRAASAGDGSPPACPRAAWTAPPLRMRWRPRQPRHERGRPLRDDLAPRDATTSSDSSRPIPTSSRSSSCHTA